ncbi:hypothetical protein C8J57DRAFT_1223648 [Mycena rebaudengoi]|nr:hypothetical protein C8J57DRAFT_1223648 [Mycena rebaudengoi]
MGRVPGIGKRGACRASTWYMVPVEDVRVMGWSELWDSERAGMAGSGWTARRALAYGFMAMLDGVVDPGFFLLLSGKGTGGSAGGSAGGLGPGYALASFLMGGEWHLVGPANSAQNISADDGERGPGEASILTTVSSFVIHGAAGSESLFFVEYLCRTMAAWGWDWVWAPLMEKTGVAGLISAPCAHPTPTSKRRTMTSKALDLLFEITSKIFLECLPFHGRIRPAPDEPPLLLAQIFQQWRSVAIATPGLWNSIALDNSSTVTAYRGLSCLFGDVGPSPDAMSLFFDLWFMRAGSHLLSITINCGEDTDAVAALSVYFPRCRTIELATDFAGINDMSGPLPYLRKLNIHVRKFRSTRFLAFPNAPKLEELRLSTVYVPFAQLRLAVPSITLTRLELHYSNTLQECLDILHNIPQLLHFSIFQHTGTEEQVSHPRRTPESPIFPLHSLELKSNADLLALVTLPHLRRLSIRFDDSDRLFAFLSRSRSNISHFHIRFDWHSIDNIDTALSLCLQAVPNVSVLRIQDYGPLSIPATQAYLLLIRCFRALSARGVRVHVESPSFSLPDDLRVSNLKMIQTIHSHQWIFSETS